MKISNEKLRVKCEDFDFNSLTKEEYNEFCTNLSRTMLDNKGLGLSANQVGSENRICVIRGIESNMFFINPRIVHSFGEILELEEGCLSFPGLLLKLKRHKSIRIRYSTLDGKTETKDFTGMTARTLQHEVDHLNGILFFDRVSKIKFNMAVRKARKLGFDYSNLKRNVI